MARPLLWNQGVSQEPNVGLLVDRPLAGAAVYGMLYYASDAGELFLCAETATNVFAWVTVPGGAAPANIAVWSTQLAWAIRRRMLACGGGPNGGLGNVTVEIQANVPATDPVLWSGFDLNRSPGTAMIVSGKLPTVPIFSGTITGITPLNVAGNVPLQFTAAALPVSWTASGAIDQRCRVTGGPNTGTVFWAMLDVGGKTARVSAPVLAPVAFPFAAPTFPVLIVTDPFSVESLITIDTFIGGGIAIPLPDDAVGIGRVIIKDLAILNGGLFGPAGSPPGGPFVFIGCNMAGSLVSNENDIGCQIQAFTPPTPSFTLCQGCYTPSTGVGQFVGCTVFLDRYFSQGGSGIEVSFGAHVSIIGDTGSFDSAFNGIQIDSVSTVIDLSHMYGDRNTNAGIQAKSGCTYAYANKPTVTGVVADTIVGGTHKAYAAIPYIEPANNAAIVVDV